MAEMSRSTKGYHESIPRDKWIVVWVDCTHACVAAFRRMAGDKIEAGGTLANDRIGDSGGGVVLLGGAPVDEDRTVLKRRRVGKYRGHPAYLHVSARYLSMTATSALASRSARK